MPSILSGAFLVCQQCPGKGMGQHLVQALELGDRIVMITVANRIPVHPDHADSFEQRFAERLGAVDSQEGFIAYRLLRPTKPEDPYVVLTFWETEQAFRAWTESDSFKQQHAANRKLGAEAFTGPVKLEVHEIVQSSGAELEVKAH